MRLPVFRHPGLPDAFSHHFIGSFPGTATEHWVVGDSGFQTGVGDVISRDDFALFQLHGKETFSWSPKDAERVKRFQETLADNGAEMDFLPTLDINVDGLNLVIVPAAVCAAVAHIH